MQRVYDVAWSSDGRWLASVGMDGLLCVWDVPPAGNFTLHKKVSLSPSSSEEGGVFFPLLSIDFSLDGKNLAIGDFRGDVTIWDVSNEAFPSAPYATLSGHVNIVDRVR